MPKFGKYKEAWLSLGKNQSVKKWKHERGKK
jgi:hypothetical protein